MVHQSSTSQPDAAPLPLHELLAKLLLVKPAAPQPFPWVFPGSGTLQGLNQHVAKQPVLDFLNYSLRGIGQVIFVNNPLSGLLILLALFLQSPWVGAMSVLGLVASTVTALALSLDRNSLRNGIFGYNGILVGAALATFGAPGNATWNPFWILAVILFAGLTTLLMQTAGVWFASQFKFPPLTLPFILATLSFLAIAAWVPQSVYSLGVPQAPAASAPLDWLRLVASVPIGFGQVFLMDRLISGLLVLLAVALCTPLGAVVGILGSVAGLLAGLLLGAPPDTLYAGLWNYNAVLTAIAIGGIFYAPNPRSLLLGGGCAFVSALLGGGLSPLFNALKLPILTLPFCLVTIAGCLMVQRSLPSLVPVALHAIASPEEHRQRYLVAKDIMTTFRQQIAAALVGQPRCYLLKSASPAVRGDLEYLFNAIDTDFSNTLSVEELAEHLRQVKRGLSQNDLTHLFQALDVDQSGQIDLAEFSELILRQQRLMSNYQEFMTYFLPIDANHDDQISLNEMNRAFASVGEPPLTGSEINFLNRCSDLQAMSWNRFIELLLVT